MGCAPPRTLLWTDLETCVAPLVPAAGLLLADMLGVGALSLPSVFARLGWLVREWSVHAMDAHACCRVSMQAMQQACVPSHLPG